MKRQGLPSHGKVAEEFLETLTPGVQCSSGIFNKSVLKGQHQNGCKGREQKRRTLPVLGRNLNTLHKASGSQIPAEFGLLSWSSLTRLGGHEKTKFLA